MERYDPWISRHLRVSSFMKTISTTPTPILAKMPPQNMLSNEGSYGVKIPWNKGTFTQKMVHEPTFMAYELRLLWHASPNFYAIWAVFIGGGGGLQYRL